jgi:protein-disulfide isomerase
MATPEVIAPLNQVPAGAPANGGGIVLGSGPAVVDAYIDFLCPFCRMFDERSGPMIDALVDRGVITLVYHPLGFLDRLSTTRYSTRAAAASGCASDGEQFREYLYPPYENQPPEGSEAGRYIPWAEYVTAMAITRGVNGTPSVYVDGLGVPASAQAITAAVMAELR